MVSKPDFCYPNPSLTYPVLKCFGNTENISLALNYLGIQLEALAFELCGTVVRQIESESCVAKDGRLKPGDLILYLNHECLWRVTSSQAKTVLRRAELVSNSIP